MCCELCAVCHPPFTRIFQSLYFAVSLSTLSVGKETQHLTIKSNRKHFHGELRIGVILTNVGYVSFSLPDCKGFAEQIILYQSLLQTRKLENEKMGKKTRLIHKLIPRKIALCYPSDTGYFAAGSKFTVSLIIIATRPYRSSMAQKTDPLLLSSSSKH